MRDITAVTVTWNSAHLARGLAECLGRLSERCEVIISDNSSTDGTPAIMRELLPSAVILENPRNGGFGYGNNRAFEHCRTPYILLLNADAAISAGDLDALAETLGRLPDAAAVQPLVRLWDWPLVTLSAGTALTRFGEGYDLDFMRFQPAPSTLVERVPGVTAAVSLFRRSALESVEGFDERFFMYFEDTDLSLRLSAAGYIFSVVPGATASHICGASSTRREAMEWELRSSALIARKFLSGDSTDLPSDWLARERRIRLSLMRRGMRSGWRRRCVGSVRRMKVRHVELPPGELEFALQSRPGREPVPRAPAPGSHLDQEGVLTAGPGWLPRGVISTCGFGCIRPPSEPGVLRLELEALDRPGSVAVWSDVGFIHRTLLAPGETTELTCRIPRGGYGLYAIPEREGMGVRLAGAEYNTVD